MSTANKEFFESVKSEFADCLVELSDGTITPVQAKQIAACNLRPTDFADDSPLQHKSVRWLAMTYLGML